MAASNDTQVEQSEGQWAILDLFVADLLFGVMFLKAAGSYLRFQHN